MTVIVVLLISMALAACGSEKDDTAISGFSVSGAGRVSISKVEGTPGRDLGTGVRELSPVFLVEGDVHPNRPARVSFDVPEGTRLSGGDVLMAATREGPDGGWVLLSGVRRGSQFVVTTRQFSMWALVSIDKDSITKATATIRNQLRSVSGRFSAPACDPTLAYHVVVSGTAGGDPILYACAEQVNGQPALHIYNNRAISLDYVPPDGTEVRTRGSGLSEAFWGAVNRGTSGASGGHLVPGGGEATIIFPPGSDLTEIRFRPTNQALTTDVMVGVLAGAAGKGTVRASAEVVEAAGCFYETSTRFGQGKLSPGDWLALFAVCGGTLARTGLALPAAVLAGAIRTGIALADQLDLLTTVSVTLFRSPVDVSPKAGPALRITGPLDFSGLAPIQIGMRINEVQSLTGLNFLPFGYGLGDCEVFLPSPGMGNATERDYLPGVSVMTTGSNAETRNELSRVSRVDVTRRGYPTAAGIRVGDSEAAVLAAYGAVQTESHHYDPGGNVLIVRSGGGRAMVFETDGSRVTQMRVGRFPEVEYVESCA